MAELRRTGAVVASGKLAGILTESDLLHHLVSGRAQKDTIVAEVMERRVSTSR
jgi:CBS domain-containing protein